MDIVIKDLCKSYGDYVEKGEQIATLYSSSDNLFDACAKELDLSLNISDIEPDKSQLIYHII